MGSFSQYDFRSRRYLPGKRRIPKWVRWINRALIIIVVIWGAYLIFRDTETLPKHPENEIEKKAELKDPAPKKTPLPPPEPESDTQAEEEEDSLPVRETLDTVELHHNKSSHVSYQKDTTLARHIDNVLRQQKPHAAFILMVDANSNEILAWGQRSDSTIHTEPTWLARSSFPAASLIKILTSVAAMESGRYGIRTEIPLIGKGSTLYSRQLRIPHQYQGNTQTLLDAFAKSSNPVMGLIGQHLGGNAMRRYADRLGFNKKVPFGSRTASRFAPPDTGYALAECASGFTRENTISPLHTAALVRAMLTRNPVELPWSRHINSALAPQSPYALSTQELSANTYYGMRELFLRTVTHGTANKYIRRTVYRQNKDELFIGGKTGSLDGTDPTGRYDWFAGFAQSRKNPQQAVVIVVMQVHDQYRTLPSPGVAGVLINHWAKGFRR